MHSVQPAYLIEMEGLELGIAVHDAGIFRFHSARAALFRLEKLRFVSLHDLQRTVRRAQASQRAQSAQRPVRKET